MKNKKNITNSEKVRNIVLLLQSYKGIGKGIWNVDAQQMVNDLRKDRKLI